MSTVVSKPTQQQPGMLIRNWLRSPALLQDIAKAMPAHCKPDRMVRVALTALTKTPKLALCTQESFFECLLSLSQWGLEPDGRRAHLIPYGNKCTLIIDYKGYVELASRAGIDVRAAMVYEGDIFVYSVGQVRDHVPWVFRTDKNRPKERGKLIAIYCQAEYAGGRPKAEAMTPEEVEKIRSRSQAANAGPWKTDWDEMAKKTVFRRLSKWLPLSADIIDAMEADADKLTIDALSVKPAQSTVDQFAENLVNQSKSKTAIEDKRPEPEIVDEEPPPVDDESQDEGEPTGTESFWADFQATLDDCSTAEELDNAVAMLVENASDPAVAQKIKEKAEMFKGLRFPKAGKKKPAKGELFDRAPNAQEE